MTLRTVLKTVAEPRYTIVALDMNSGEWERCHINYTGNTAEFRKAAAIRQKWVNSKNVVKYITYNKATECIDISIDLL